MRLSIIFALMLGAAIVVPQPITTSSYAQTEDASICDTDPQSALETPLFLNLQSEFSNESDFEVRTQGIWAVWWDPKFDHEEDATWLLNRLDDVRCRSLNDLGMQDPPNPNRFTYYNVYIHHGENDAFPAGWGNGQGTDGFGNPFLTLPDGAATDRSNVDHEGFHVFQYSANSTGFEYRDDSQWYIEAAAQWYSVYRDSTSVISFLEAGAIEENPQLTLWHSFGNEAPGDPVDWLFQVRQYGMHTYLYYLTEIAGVEQDVITAGFYNNTFLLPQEYHYEQIGAERLRNIFADWAAHNSADFDYLTREQVVRARQEVVFVGDANNTHRYVAEHSSEGTNGDWLRPPSSLAPRSWAYNVIRINNAERESGSFRFQIAGDIIGSEGASPFFLVRAVVMSPDGATYTDGEFVDSLNSSVTVDMSSNDSDIYFVVASIPEWFRGNQTYNYQYKIDQL